VTVQYRGQHQGFVQQRVDPLFVCHDPHYTVLRERPRTVRQESNTLQNIFDNHRFEHVQLSRVNIRYHSWQYTSPQTGHWNTQR
jgi:hypothetical protein